MCDVLLEWLKSRFLKIVNEDFRLYRWPIVSDLCHENNHGKLLVKDVASSFIIIKESMAQKNKMQKLPPKSHLCRELGGVNRQKCY